MAAAISTPINTISRENLTVLIRNNFKQNESLDFGSDCDCSMMETDSPIRKPSLQTISKKLFHSPIMDESPSDVEYKRSNKEIARLNRKRKQMLLPSSAEKIKQACVRECERDGYSPEACEGMRKRVLISLFHNKEYAMEL